MIDPRRPDFANTPASPTRPRFEYAPAAAGPPHVSIVTPLSAWTPGVEHAVATVRGQSLLRWEWLLLDGGLSAADLQRVEASIAGDARVRILPGAQTPGAAWNAGFAAAQTDWVLQLAAGDQLEPTALEKLSWRAASNGSLDVVNAWSVDAAGRTLHAPRYGWAETLLAEGPRTTTALVRRAAFERVGGYDPGLAEDVTVFDFFVRCLRAGCLGETVREHLVWLAPAAAPRCAELPDHLRRHLRGRYPEVATRPPLRTGRRRATPYEPVRTDPPIENPLQRKKPRLLLVTAWLTLGGAEKFNLDLVRVLRERGWEVTVATTMPAEHEWRPDFGRLTPDIFLTHELVAPADQPLLLRYLIASRAPDVVMLTNSELGYLLLPYLRSVCPEPAYVDYSHMEEENWQHGGYPRYAAACQDELDLNLVSSQHLKEWLTRRGADRSAIQVVTTNVDVQKWRPQPEARAALRARLGIAADEPVILFAARLGAQKRPRVLAAAARELRERGCNFRLLVAGTGEDSEWLRGFVAEHDLAGHVLLLGAVATEEMPDVFAAADIFFLPSLWEGVALTLYEAMAAGLAIVATDVGGQRELVTPECGVLVPLSADDAAVALFSAELEKLLADPARTAALGAAGRARVAAHFRLDALADGVLAAFSLAAGRKAAARRPAIGARTAHECATRAVEHMRMAALLGYNWTSPQVTLPQDAAAAVGAGEIVDLTPRLREQAAWIQELQRANDWFREQYSRYQALASEYEATAAAAREQLQSAHDAYRWLEEHSKQSEARAQKQEQTIRELQAWTHDLEAGKRWLEEQWRQSRARIGELEIQHEQLRRWARELEEAKRFHEQQLSRVEAELRRHVELAGRLEVELGERESSLAAVRHELTAAHAEIARLGNTDRDAPAAGAGTRKLKR